MRAASLGISKNHLDVALGSLIWVALREKGLGRVASRSSHLSHPVTDPAVCSPSQLPNNLGVNTKKIYHDKPNKEGNVHIFNILQRYLHWTTKLPTSNFIIS